MIVTTKRYDAFRYKAAAPSLLATPAGVSASRGTASEGAAGGGDISGQITDYLGKFNADDARSWRSGNIWCDTAIRRRMDAMRDQEWSIGPINSREEWDKDVAARITAVLENPSAILENNTFGGAWGAAMDDTYTIGYGVMQLLLNKNLTPRGYKPLDAARFHQNREWDPNTTEGDKPNGNPDDTTKRWYIEQGPKKVYFASAEIIVMVPYLSTHDRTGLSPMKALRSILQAELDTRRNMHGTQKFRIPPGVFIMPGAQPGSPERMRLMWDIKMAGRFAPAFMNLPKDSKWIEFGGINLLAQGTFQFYEILVRATASAFGTTPFMLGWTDQDNRANSTTQLVISDRGETAMLKFVRQIVNRYFIQPFIRAGERAQNLRHNFLALSDEDELEDAQSLRAKAGPIGFISVNELRRLSGLTEYKAEDFGQGMADLVWPFVSQPWVPSKFNGIMLPLEYAAMSFGLGPSVTPDQIVTVLAGAMQGQTATNGSGDPADIMAGLTMNGASDEQRKRLAAILGGKEGQASQH